MASATVTVCDRCKGTGGSSWEEKITTLDLNLPIDGINGGRKRVDLCRDCRTLFWEQMKEFLGDPLVHLGTVELTREQQRQADALTFRSAPSDWAEQFRAAYTKKTGANDIDNALYGQIAILTEKTGQTEQQCFEYLLAKAKEYSASRFVKTCVDRQKIPSPALWLTSGRYRDDPAEWNIDATAGQKRPAGQSTAPTVKPRPVANRVRSNDNLGEELQRMMEE